MSKKKGPTLVSSENLLTLGKLLREARSSVLKTSEGVVMGKRIDYFEGKAFLEALRKVKIKDAKLREQVKNFSEDDLKGLSTQMMKAHYFHEAEVVYKADTEDKTVDDVDRLEIVESHEFHPEAFYSWILPVSQTRLALMTFSLLVGAIVVCLFKIWPLWAKIGAWWVSFVLLISLLSISGVRIVLAVLCWLVGFRGIWLFPNLFDDQVSVWETFHPLWGYGRLADEAKRKKKLKQEQKEQKEKEEKEKAENDKKDEASKDGGIKKPKTQTKEKTPSTPIKKESYPDNAWKFGFINFGLIMIVGLIVCNYFGLLAGENIPEFLISQQEIWNTYPSLLAAPPKDVNATIIEENSTVDTGDDPDAPSFDHLLDGED